jgi:hypothetical protein
VLNIKIVNASQACIHWFKNLKKKLCNYNANMFFNQECLKQYLTPSYSKFKNQKISHISSQKCKKIQILRLKDEIKFLYISKHLPSIFYTCVCVTYILFHFYLIIYIYIYKTVYFDPLWSGRPSPFWKVQFQCSWFLEEPDDAITGRNLLLKSPNKEIQTELAVTDFLCENWIQMCHRKQPLVEGF